MRGTLFESVRRIGFILTGTAAVIIALGFAAPQGAATAKQAGAAGFVTASGTQFIDGGGKPLILHGVNVENKVKAQGYIGDLGTPDFVAIRKMGMNCIRLLILWDGFEPQPESYEVNCNRAHSVLARWQLVDRPRG